MVDSRTLQTNQWSFSNMGCFALRQTGYPIYQMKALDLLQLIRVLTCGLEMLEGTIMVFIMWILVSIQMHFGLSGNAFILQKYIAVP